MAKEIQEVNRQTAQVKKARRFDDRDWKWIADFVVDEWTKRKRKREEKNLDKQWAEIDRQIRMEPEVEFKKLSTGKPDYKKQWMAETELPLQAQALEILTADSRRMMFPDSGPWFRAHAQVTDEYLQAAQSNVKILGVEHPIESGINQDNADKLVEGFLNDIFHQFDLPSKIDIVNSESFKYGTGVGRARMERKNIYINEARGVRVEKKLLPVLVPCSIKSLYLEEKKPTLHSSTVLGESVIAHDYLKYENIVLAANKGSNDPDDEDGGWMPKGLAKIVPDKDGFVQVIEMEGDIVVPRKTVKSVVIPGAIITVAVGGPESGGSATRAVIRFRYRKYPYSSYVLFPYMHENSEDAYASGPLMKGRTVQMAATDSLNRYLDSAMLKNAPPTSYDPSSPYFAQTGGPYVHPYAQWETMDPITVHTECGGDPSALAQATLQFINLYAQLTGVLPARIGAQTVSHTTAYAKNAELQRGATRTVDYVNQTGQGPMTRFLYMAYQMGRDALRKNEELTLWIDQYDGWVSLDKSCLPEISGFEWFGAGGPAEKQSKDQTMIQAAELGFKIDALRMQTGKAPYINSEKLIDNILERGGWTDLESITNANTGTQGMAGAPQTASAMAGPAGPNPGAAVAALQNLSTGQS